jgi:hypothetical protein
VPPNELEVGRIANQRGRREELPSNGAEMKILWSLCIGLVITLAQAAHTRDIGAPLAPRVEFWPVHASQIRLGMAAAGWYELWVMRHETIPFAVVTLRCSG